MLAPTGPTPPVGGGDSEKAQLPLLNRVILNRYRTEKYFLPEESYFILGLMYFLRAAPKSDPLFALTRAGLGVYRGGYR